MASLKTHYCNFNYIDPQQGCLQSDYCMTISENKILKIGSSSIFTPEEKAECELIDLEGKFITPGLINIHCHLTGSGKKIPGFLQKWEKLTKWLRNKKFMKKIFIKMMTTNAQTALYAGITTIRTLGDASLDILEIRTQIANGSMLGPRIFSAGKGIAGIGGHGSLLNFEVDSVEEATRITEEMIELGVDWIKVMATGGVTDAKTPEEAGMPQMSIELMKAVCDVAHKHGVKVSAHCLSNEGTWNCIHAGIDSIEHGSDYTDEIINAIKENNIATIPTLAAPRAYSSHSLKESGLNEINMQNNLRILERIDIGLRQAKKFGILIGAGTDAGIPMVRHDEFVQELLFMTHDHDFTPIEALTCATLNNAKILGQEEHLGSLAPNKYADFLIFSKNPLEDLNILFKPEVIVKNGKKMSHQ